MLTPFQKKRLYKLLGIFLFMVGIVLIGVTAFYQEMSFFVTPSTLKNGGKGSFLRLGGMVQKGSYKCLNNEILFVVEDENDAVNVLFKGALPPLFKEGQGIVVEGHYNQKDKVFIADTVFAKHDETYMPKSVVNTLKENGQWRPSS
ncbi:MAG: Cytochrome c-type biogenesis protein CcmE [Holosporales bacterium]